MNFFDNDIIKNKNKKINMVIEGGQSNIVHVHISNSNHDV